MLKWYFPAILCVEGLKEFVLLCCIQELLSLIGSPQTNCHDWDCFQFIQSLLNIWWYYFKIPQLIPSNDSVKVWDSGWIGLPIFCWTLSIVADIRDVLRLDFLLSWGDSLSWHKFESTFLSIGPQFPKQCFFLSRLPVFTHLSIWLELY